MIIGICGGSGSGKTTLLRKLAEHFRELHPAVFSMDNYYLPIGQQLIDNEGQVNFDLPSALNKELLLSDLHKLLRGETVEVKEYQFNRLPYKEVMLTIKPSQLIIVEGLFLFAYEELRKLIDISIFIEVDPEQQLERRLRRDAKKRACTPEEIAYQWNNHVIPCYDQYLLPYKEQANFRFNSDYADSRELDRLLTFLTPRLDD